MEPAFQDSLEPHGLMWEHHGAQSRWPISARRCPAARPPAGKGVMPIPTEAAWTPD